MSRKKNSNKNYFWIFFIIFLGLNVLTNWFCKYVATNDLLPENNILRFTFVHNSGAAFNLFESKISFLIAVGILALIYILYKIYFSKISPNKVALTGFASMFAGITHNLYERIYLGFVIDYFDLTFIKFPVFNLADVLITFGAIVLIQQILAKKL